MTNCVCGHALHDHFASDGMCYQFECGCSFMQPDDGSDAGPLGVRNEAYTGFYKGPYQLTAEEAAGTPPPLPVFACGVCHIAWNGDAVCPSCGKDSA